MQLCLQNYTVDRPHAEPIRIKAGIGLHAGEVIIGIMGNAQNMDTGIVSDTVNAASRIEGLTKYFGVNILLSEKVVERLDPKKSAAFRFIGRVRMKGKLNDIGLYECFDGDLAEMKAKKLATLAPYQQAFELYSSKQFKQAAAEFGQLTHINSADPVLKYYHHQTAKLIDEVVPENWNPVEEIEIK